MKKLTLTIFLLLAIVLPLLVAYLAFRPDQRLSVQANLDLSQELGNTEDAGFAKVLRPREFSFPVDHGPHLEYGVEWWYYTGNLDNQEGRQFGFELTLFRIGLTTDSPQRASDWAASQVYMGHFAVTDVKNNRFYAFERFSRDGLGLAGASVAETQGFRVWLEDWSIDGEGATEPAITLRAAEEDVAIELTLVSAKPLVLQGDRGFSQKSAETGNASYYYSITRMPTSGTVSIGPQSFAVQGNSWMDREWSTSALSEEQEGWDWFALQLSDGSELMYYQLRLEDGGLSRFSGGIVVLGDCSTISISANDVSILVLDVWESSRGVSYPAKWQLQVPSQSIDLEIEPLVDDQELDVSVRYWEGAVKVSGKSRGLPVGGNGYVEMTGYSDELRGRSPK